MKSEENDVKEAGIKELERVGAISVGEHEEICFSVVKLRGKKAFDVRLFAVFGDSKEMRPTKRGFVLTPASYKKFESLTKELGTKV